MSVYVLQVGSQEEYNVKRRLKKYNYSVYVPSKIMLERRLGSVKSVNKIIFVGYVFVELDEMTEVDYYNLKHTAGVTKILDVNYPLNESEEEFIKWLNNGGRAISPSLVTMDNGHLKIVSGKLAEYECYITWFNIRQKRARITFEFMGKVKRIVLAIMVI